MIQRIQSIYMTLALILTIVLFAFPLATIVSDNGIYLINAFSFIKQSTKPEIVKHLYSLTAIIILNSILLLICIFQYKNRRQQMNFIKLSIIIQFALIAVLVFYVINAQMVVTGNFNFQIVSIFPLINIVLLILSYKKVKKDDELVRSVDRIR